jgi:hypothetical protein
MQSWMLDPKQAVIDAKAALLARMPDYAERMAILDRWLAGEVAAVRAEGAAAIPQSDWRSMRNLPRYFSGSYY